jgi:hypothetical protein
VLLAGPDGRRAGRLYAAGATLTLLVIVGSLVFFGRAISLPTEPRLDATLDIVLGLVLVAVAGLVYAAGRARARHRGTAEPPQTSSEPPRTSPHRAQAALPFGAFSMATNVTTLALMAPAAKEISSSGADLAGRILLVAVVVTLAALPAWAPVALTAIAPEPGRRALDALSGLIDRYGRVATLVLLAAGGLFFVGRGIVRLIG